MNDLDDHRPYCCDRWFAYLDLLGFTKLVESKYIEDVLSIYGEALNHMCDACKFGQDKIGLNKAWFSDTFIIYSRSDSLEDFKYLEQAARIFFEILIIKEIPVRGCISHGELYAQAEQNIFVGPALIEAYKYGEALNWIGFCLAPSVEKKLKNDFPLDQWPFYRKVTDKDILNKVADECLYVYAFAFNNAKTNNDENLYLSPLLSMKRNASPEAAQKYENSLAFLLKNHTSWKETMGKS